MFSILSASVDSKWKHITFSFLWKAPFLMIWQPVDTEAFQKKNSIPLPTASASPSDKWHLSFCHRQAAQIRLSLMYGSPEQEINFFNPQKEKPKRADQDIARILLPRPHLSDRLNQRPKKFVLMKEKETVKIKTGRNMDPWRSLHRRSCRQHWLCLFLCSALDISHILTHSGDLWRERFTLLCENSIFLLEPQQSESNQRLFVKAKLLQFYSSEWKARTLPMPPKRFPLHKDCPQKINNLVFSCWWQSQDRAGGGLFVFIFFQFFHPHLPHDPYILDSKNICFFPSIKRNHYPEINLSLWFKRQTQKQHQIAPEHLMGVISVLGLKWEVKRPIARFSLHRISQPGTCWH